MLMMTWMVIKKDDKGETETPGCKQEMFKHFWEWLQGADGGRKEEHAANQCSRQVKMVLEYIDRENRDLENILSKRILNLKSIQELLNLTLLHSTTFTFLQNVKNQMVLQQLKSD